jgi:predicted RecB family nuclease
VRGARGALEHYEFLAEGAGDPRPAIADAVIAACKGARSVVAYFASFEKARLEHLAANVPSRRKALLDVVARLVDLHPIVRDNVYHPDFGGSFSLKSVTPALVRGLGYDDLEIGEGNTAQALLEGMLLGSDVIPVADRKKLRRQLLDYCERDTLATVKVYERLLGLV